MSLPKTPSRPLAWGFLPPKHRCCQPPPSSSWGVGGKLKKSHIATFSVVLPYRVSGNTLKCPRERSKNSLPVLGNLQTLLVTSNSCVTRWCEKTYPTVILWDPLRIMLKLKVVCHRLPTPYWLEHGSVITELIAEYGNCTIGFYYSMRYSSCGNSMATSMASCLILPLKKLNSKLCRLTKQERS